MHLAPERIAAAEVIRQLSLEPHPEGGFYREVYRAREQLTLPRGTRACSTAIYFLVTAEAFSSLHRIAADEVWHFYTGDAVDIPCLAPDGTRTDLRLGLDLTAGERPQHVVPARSWFGARVAAGGAWALVGCTVAPGFDFADFELAGRASLTALYPAHATLVAELTRLP